MCQIKIKSLKTKIPVLIFRYMLDAWECDKHLLDDHPYHHGMSVRV